MAEIRNLPDAPVSFGRIDFRGWSIGRIVGGTRIERRQRNGRWESDRDQRGVAEEL